MMRFRKAEKKDIDRIAQIYERIHEEEESGAVTIGWIRDVYPVRQTALDALSRGDLFVLEEDGRAAAAAVINRVQVPCYREGAWKHEAAEDKVMVLHTLVVDPAAGGKGLGKAFVDFYEQYAAENGCTELRMDTNARNTRARRMYRKLGYEEIGVVPCVFNGIPDVQLVLLEKQPGKE